MIVRIGRGQQLRWDWARSWARLSRAGTPLASSVDYPSMPVAQAAAFRFRSSATRSRLPRLSHFWWWQGS
jgi:hypothetical protein